MPELVQVQRCIQAYLLNGGSVDALPIVRTKKVSNETRAGIYFDGYRIRLREALASNYPCLCNYLGESVFNEIADDYLAENPSEFRSIRWFGDKLQHFLEKSRIEHHEWLAEMADLEWKMALAFDAADSESLTIEDIVQVSPQDWGKMRFTAHPSLQRFDALWNTLEIWQNLSEELPLCSLQKQNKPQPWVIWRRDYMNRYYLLSDDEQCALDGLLQGEDFATICSNLLTLIAEEQVVNRAASLLKGWVQSGLLSTISI